MFRALLSFFIVSLLAAPALSEPRLFNEPNSPVEYAVEKFIGKTVFDVNEKGLVKYTFAKDGTFEFTDHRGSMVHLHYKGKYKFTANNQVLELIYFDGMQMYSELMIAVGFDSRYDGYAYCHLSSEDSESIQEAVNFCRGLVYDGHWTIAGTYLFSFESAKAMAIDNLQIAESN